MLDRLIIEGGRMTSFSSTFNLLPNRGKKEMVPFDFFFSSCLSLVDFWSGDWLIDWSMGGSPIDMNWGCWADANGSEACCFCGIRITFMLLNVLQIRFLGIVLFAIWNCFCILALYCRPIQSILFFNIGGSESFPCVATFISGQLLQNVYISCFESEICFFFFVSVSCVAVENVLIFLRIIEVKIVRIFSSVFLQVIFSFFIFERWESWVDFSFFLFEDRQYWTATCVRLVRNFQMICVRLSCN